MLKIKLILSQNRLRIYTQKFYPYQKINCCYAFYPRGFSQNSQMAKFTKNREKVGKFEKFKKNGESCGNL